VVSLAVLGVYLPHLSGVASDDFRAASINLALGLGAVAALAGLTVLPLRLLDFRLQRRAKSVAPAAAAQAKAEDRSGRVGRAAALLGLLILVVGGIPLANRLHRSYAPAIQSPSQALARWIQPPRDELIIIRGSFRVQMIDFYLDVSAVRTRIDVELAEPLPIVTAIESAPAELLPTSPDSSPFIPMVEP
jgi:hypothetical protein